MEPNCSGGAGSPLPPPPEGVVDDPCVLSGEKPFFDLILTKTHVSEPYTLNLAKNVVKHIPDSTKLVKVSHGGNTWDLEYYRTGRFRRLRARDWKIFIADNKLSKNDACIFEVMGMQETTVYLKAVFMRNTNLLPPEFLASLENDVVEVEEVNEDSAADEVDGVIMID